MVGGVCGFLRSFCGWAELEKALFSLFGTDGRTETKDDKRRRNRYSPSMMVMAQSTDLLSPLYGRPRVSLMLM
jgi:hypothetical protein